MEEGGSKLFSTRFNAFLDVHCQGEMQSIENIVVVVVFILKIVLYYALKDWFKSVLKQQRGAHLNIETGLACPNIPPVHTSPGVLRKAISVEVLGDIVLVLCKNTFQT